MLTLSCLPAQIWLGAGRAAGWILGAERVTVNYRAVEARYPSGKGEVCKTFMRGFDSHPRLQ